MSPHHLTGDEGCVVSVRALQQPFAAGRQVVVNLRWMKLQAVVVDDVEVCSQLGCDAAAIGETERRRLVNDIRLLPDLVGRCLDREGDVQAIARELMEMAEEAPDQVEVIIQMMIDADEDLFEEDQED